MAFSPLEYLEHGNVEFLDRLPQNDINDLIKWIRESDRKEQIMNGCLFLIKDRKRNFCFEIIYDIPKYKNEAWELLHKIYTPSSLDKHKLINIMYRTSYGSDYLKENFYEIINSNNEYISDILPYLFSNYDVFSQILKELSLSKDLHIRYLFMRYLVTFETDKINLFYDDITRYLTSVTHELYEQYTFMPEYMDIDDICELASIILTNCDYEIYLKIKQFIFANYETNELGNYLLNPDYHYSNDHCYNCVQNDKKTDELKNDVDNYFKTANKGKIQIYKDFSHLLSKELLEKYKQYLSYFRIEDKIDTKFSKIDYVGLSNKLERYVDKYLSLSKTDEHYFIESGTTASAFKIGDFVFKLILEKWSYEDVICPNLYLIIPNLEEDYIRDSKNIVRAGIEVQKYLKRSAKDVPSEYFDLFKDEINKLGYYVNDTLMDGAAGDNCRLLDDYLESGNQNPPEWFKKYPIVLIDRDRVYELDNKRPKQLLLI